MATAPDATELGSLPATPREESNVADASIVCWNCNAIASPDATECQRCKAGLRPPSSEGADERFLEEQTVLRQRLGLEASGLSSDVFASRWKHDRVTQPVRSVAVQAKHASGLDLTPKANVSLWFANDQVYFVVRDVGPVPIRYLVTEASDVGYICIESAGTKSNVAALAFFGILALGARRDWLALSIDLAGSPVVVLVREPVYTMRETMRLAVERCPSLEGKITEGPPPPSHANSPRPEPADSRTDLVAEMERLAAMYEKGLITDEEFSALKAALIAGD